MGANFRVLDNWAVRYASENGHLEVVKYLVEKDSDFQVGDNHAVRFASRNGHLEVVKYLVENGADFRADDNYSIRCASLCGRLEVVKYLVEKGEPENLISNDARDYIRQCKILWSRRNHLDFSVSTNKLFGSLFLGIQRLEESGAVPLAHQAMLEDILEG